MRTPFLLLVVSALSIGGVTAAPDASDVPERTQFTENDLPKDEDYPTGISEIDDFARRRGFNYAKLTRRAARGDAKALKRFFEIARDADGAAAESHGGVPAVVYHLLGDEKFAAFLKRQPLDYRTMVRNLNVGDATAYFRRYFPETTKLLFQREIVSWLSPDQRFAIRKIFTDADLRGSKVERAELIEQKSGQVLCDLTHDDIGIGADREGEVLWSPDSKRFAYLSSDLTPFAGNLFSTPRPTPQRKQTVVYQLDGETCTRVDVNLTDVPGRESDAELKRAILGHDYITPTRWEKPNVLILDRHEYFETLKPTVVGDQTFDTIHTLSRQYWITVTIAADGKAVVVWKLRKDRSTSP